VIDTPICNSVSEELRNFPSPKTQYNFSSIRFMGTILSGYQYLQPKFCLCKISGGFIPTLCCSGRGFKGRIYFTQKEQERRRTTNVGKVMKEIEDEERVLTSDP